MVSEPNINPDQLRLVEELGNDRWLAHQFLFKKRHPIESPAFHEEMVKIFHGPDKFAVMQAFRDGGKSTNAEEDVVVSAMYKEFEYCIIVGSSEDRAIDRLRSIKSEIANNDQILSIYGNQVGGTWAETKIVLKNGVAIQALGREQSIRGLKHLDKRPDFCLLDDLEDETTAKDEKSITGCMKWIMKTLMPACQPMARYRMIGTPLHPEAIVCQFARDPEWTSRVWPIKYRDETGWKSSWPAKFPLEEIDKLEARYRRFGQLTAFTQEYMCRSQNEEEKPFSSDMYRVRPTARSWHGVYSCYDPARTQNVKTSAQTGKAVWSWINNRLIVWKASGHFWKPDEIIDDIIRTSREFNPILIGVEKDGLDEFIEQPLRQAMVREQLIVPYKALKAPVGKMDFIKGLQPFAKAGELIFAEECGDAREQLESFPNGRVDILNALAYALKMRPGRPVYEDFGDRHISSVLTEFRGRPYWLCLNADKGIVSGALVQMEGGRMRIFADWIRDGDMVECIKEIIADAKLEAQGRLKLIAAPETLQMYSASGMKMAASQSQSTILKGADPATGREVLREMMRRARQSVPELQVQMSSLWTLRALAGGYALDEKGVAVEGPYKLVMEGIECLAALMKAGLMTEKEEHRNYATGKDGSRYLSTRPHMHGNA